MASRYILRAMSMSARLSSDKTGTGGLAASAPGAADLLLAFNSGSEDCAVAVWAATTATTHRIRGPLETIMASLPLFKHTPQAAEEALLIRRLFRRLLSRWRGRLNHRSLPLCHCPRLDSADDMRRRGHRLHGAGRGIVPAGHIGNAGTAAVQRTNAHRLRACNVNFGARLR